MLEINDLHVHYAIADKIVQIAYIIYKPLS